MREQSDHADRREGGPLHETVGSNTFLILPCTVGKQVEERRDEILSWLEDTSEGGGADLLRFLPEAADDFDRGLRVDVEKLRAVDVAYSRVLVTLFEKFDFDYFFYENDGGSSTDVAFSSVLREYSRGRYWEKVYICARDDKGSGAMDVCDAEGCVSLALPSRSKLSAEQLGYHSRRLLTCSFSEEQFLALRIMLQCSYLRVVLSGSGHHDSFTFSTT